MNSRGRPCGLIPAAIGSFLASSSGLLVAIVGTQFAIVRFLPAC